MICTTSWTQYFTLKPCTCTYCWKSTSMANIRTYNKCTQHMIHSAASDNITTCCPSDITAFLYLVQSLGLTEASIRPNTTRSSHTDGHHNYCSRNKTNSDKAGSNNKDCTGGGAFAQTTDEPPDIQSAAKLILARYSTHDNGELYGWYTILSSD